MRAKVQRRQRQCHGTTAETARIDLLHMSTHDSVKRSFKHSPFTVSEPFELHTDTDNVRLGFNFLDYANVAIDIFLGHLKVENNL